MSGPRKRPPLPQEALSAEGRRLLWDAINRYARASGGDPSACSYPSRKPAIADIEALLLGTPYAKPRRLADKPEGGAPC